MDSESIFRRLRGAAGNALVWGAGWATLGLAAFAALKVTGFLSPQTIWLDGLLIAARFGFIGGIVGGAFAGLVGLLYRGQRLSRISVLRFGVGGGIMAGLFVPVFLQSMNLLSGGGMVPMELVLDDGLWAAVFGTVAAGGSLKLAQAAHTLRPGAGPHPLGLAGGDHRVPDGWDARDRATVPHRAGD